MERYSIILVCFILLLLCIYYLYLDVNHKPDKALLAKKQRDGLDNYLLPLGYRKELSSYHLHPYVKLIIHTDRKGELISYRNENLGKSVQLFFDTTFSDTGFLKALILLQHNAPKGTQIINHHKINTKFKIDKNLNQLRPKEITKYLKSLNKFAETNDILDISKQQSNLSSTIALTFDFLELHGFKKCYSFIDGPNYFGIPIDLLAYENLEIEIIVSLVIDRDIQSLNMTILKNGTVIENSSKRSTPSKTNTFLNEFKNHIQNNYC